MSEKHLPHNHTHTDDAAKLSHHLEKLLDFQIVSDVFKQLSDSSRVRIFWLLCHCEECVINISEKKLKILTFLESNMFSTLFRKMRILEDIK